MFYTITIVRRKGRAVQRTETGPLEEEDIPVYVKDFHSRKVPYSDGKKPGFFVSQLHFSTYQRLGYEQLLHVA